MGFKKNGSPEETDQHFVPLDVPEPSPDQETPDDED